MCSFFKGKTEKKIGCKTVLCLWMQLTNNTYMQRMYHASAHSTDRYKFAYMAQHDVEMSRHIQTGRQKVKQIQWNRNKKESVWLPILNQHKVYVYMTGGKNTC